MSDTNLRVLRLEITDLRRIQVFAQDLGPEVTVIGGRNGAGKSTALDALCMALGGGSVGQEPVREGEREAKVVTYLGSDQVEYTVTLRIKANGDKTLDVRRPDGRAISSPQTWLNSMVGKLALDPLTFFQKSGAEQLADFKRVTGLDFTDLDNQTKRLEQLRLDAGRERDRVDGYLKTLPVHEDAPADEISVADIAKEIQRINGVNRENDEKRGHPAVYRRSADAAKRRVEEITAQLARAQADAQAAESAAIEAESAAVMLIDEDATGLHSEIANAEVLNAKVRDNRAHAASLKEFEAHKSRWNDLDAQLTAIIAEKKRQIAAAHMPVEGLGFGSDCVTFNGHPLSVASASEKLRVSTALSAELCPQMKLCILRDGPLLDEGGVKLVTEWARDKGMQVIMERVGSGPEVNILIENGLVSEVRSGQAVTA